MPDGPLYPSETDTHALNAASYDRIAEHYLSWSLRHQSLADPFHPTNSNTPFNSTNPRILYLNKLLSCLSSPSTAHILDLGCGAGVPCTQILARECYEGRVVGVDSSSAQIALARKYVLGESPEQSDRGKDVMDRQQQRVSVAGGEEAEDVGDGGEKGTEREGRGDGASRPERGVEHFGTDDTTKQPNPSNQRQQDEANPIRNDQSKGLAQVDLLVADMATLTFPPSTFNAVVAFYSIIHLPRSEQRSLLTQIHGWLSDQTGSCCTNVTRDEGALDGGVVPNNANNTKNEVGLESSDGYLLLNLGTSDDPGTYDAHWLGTQHGRMFWSSFDTETNINMIREVGFEVVESAVVYDEEGDGDGEDGKTVSFLWVLARKA